MNCSATASSKRRSLCEGRPRLPETRASLHRPHRGIHRRRSFVTTKSEPNDVDVFLLMADSFDVSVMTGETRLLFDHLAADAHFGASVFWLRRLAAWEGEQAAVEYWQVKRDGQRRGVVEIDLGAS